ncbi:hypothetical protein BCR35DRAFT_18582 [Leucosporidium creatinivorum]|uniref:Uncharacterized protein n=1 Tax=Leucosporidium creatinivorum TaxID=106004 RepID=A0A1Y2D0L4_9BASI|nr:hypothetical protein BCR35DRAFT_18582 [Leucosporidium creatinivorum]
MASNTASVSSPCRWYNYGYCWRGSSCPNSHSTPLQNSDGDDLSFTVHPGSTSAAGAVTLNFGAPPPPSPSPAPLASATASTSAAISNPIPTAPNDQEEDDEEEICAICYEPQVEWGLLDNCSHTFCMPCIRSWTTPRGDQTHAQAEAGKTCPACRRKCQVVVPSTAFLREGEERRRRIREFKGAFGVHERRGGEAELTC